MSEAIPVLAYRTSGYRRRPFLVVLAILAAAVGLTAVGLFVFSTIRIGSQYMFRSPGLPRSAMVNMIIGDASAMLHWLALSACAFAFLARSKWVVFFLSAYFYISIGGALLTPALAAWADFGSGNFVGLWLVPLRTIGGMAYSIIDLIMLLLLQVREVRQVILAFTEVREQSF